ncbi:AzlD domain-containing protein [Xenorhabdus lircayensis]|uniref:AzlD domain-containing protein n=1 Tax=Xenorhabdus lircayensis TaxID=2763499 RepID=A0ABS0U9N3_9GAMM|nr:AzlD domain-containing protein [Xenorhabdus lircayensis]MBI6550327.1 AzlD domain-containing protein [Xenorhabdus lircayensis]
MMLLIVLMGLISFVLRVAPFLISNNRLFRGKSLLITSLDYAICFILGTIIVNISLNNLSLNELIEQFDIKYVLALVTVILAYFISKFTQSILKSLVLSLAFFMLMQWLLS